MMEDGTSEEKTSMMEDGVNDLERLVFENGLIAAHSATYQ